MSWKAFRVINIFSALVIMLVNVLTLRLYFEDNLTLYIHPRYVFFTFIASCLSLIVLLNYTVLLINRYRHRTVDRGAVRRPSLLTLIVILFLVATSILPPRPLMSSGVVQRFSGSSDSALACELQNKGEIIERFVVLDTMLNGCTNADAYSEQRLKIQGFVYDEPGYSTAEYFTIARYRVSCCAIDADPLLLKVLRDDTAKQFAGDKWLDINGRIEARVIGGILTPVIIPENIKEINAPDEPYEFL